MDSCSSSGYIAIAANTSQDRLIAQEPCSEAILCLLDCRLDEYSRPKSMYIKQAVKIMTIVLVTRELVATAQSL